MDKVTNNYLAVEEDFDENIEIDAAEEQVEEDNKLSTIKKSVNEKEDEKEKLDEWLNQINKSECKESALSKAKVFSSTSLFGLVKMLALLFSLSESS